MATIWPSVMPPEAFAGARHLIQNAVGDGWGEMDRRMPALVS